MTDNIDKISFNSKTLVFKNEPLSKHTTFGVGGNAHYLILPCNLRDTSMIFKSAYKKNIKIFLMGSGSNILASDEGYNGIVISLKKVMNKIKFKEKEIYVQAGAMLGTMVKQAISRGYKGFESLIGVPGTVGGALIMNAGAHGSEISELFLNAKTIDKKGSIKEYTKNDISFTYRDSTFPSNEILLEANFKILKGNKNKILKRKVDVSDTRKKTQPLRFRSAGSIFKNPSIHPAGYLIDKAGLKGLRIGDAEISTKHANFIINHGKAKSKDILYLIKIIKNKVKEKFDIDLELEIKLLGIQEWYWRKLKFLHT